MKPRFFLAAGRAAVVAVAALGAPGCVGEDEKQVLPPVVLGMENTIPPAYDDGQVQLYQVTREVRLPLREPRDDERSALSRDMPPYRREPFQKATDTRITIRFTLTNLEAVPHTVTLLVDPWNEFVRYVPGVVVDDEEILPNFSGHQRNAFIIPPKSRVEGIITADDVVEMATDLVTAMNIEARPPAADGQFGGPVLYNRAFNLQNRSSEPDPVLAPYVPNVAIAGITGFDLGLRTTQPAKIAVELVIDIEDRHGDRMIEKQSDGDPIGEPGRELTPPMPVRMN
jgi:hypothetical protein